MAINKELSQVSDEVLRREKITRRFQNQMKIFKKHEDVILAFTIPLAIVLSVLDYFIHVNFYFNGDFSDFRNWFPTFYPALFLLFKGLFPVVYGLWLIAILRKLKATNWIIGTTLLVQTLLWLICLEYLGFNIASNYTFLLIIFHLVARHYSILFALAKNVWQTIADARYAIFLTYIIASLLIGNFHPFYQFPMFKQFPREVDVLFLEDQEQNIIPIRKYSPISENAIFILNKKIKKKHGCQEGWKGCNRNEVGREVLGHFLTRTYKNPAYITDSIRLVEKTYRLKDDTIHVREKQLYKVATK